MSNSSTNSGSSSARTSASAQQKPTETDQQYLQRQANAARDAMTRMTGALKSDLVRGADPRLWLKQYPWATLAASTVAGFAAAAVAVPSKEQQALKRLARIEAALRPERDRDGATTANGNPRRKRSVLGRVLLRTAKTLQPLVISTLTGAITGKMAQPSEEDMAAATNPGHQI